MARRTVHVCTVHWRSDRWIDVQLSYLARNLALPVRTYASLNDINPAHHDKFSVALDLPGQHAPKLNELARRVTEYADPDDFLMFLDGDAFPVVPLDGWLERTLERYPLAAARRDENYGDRQPHPCFCVTTVGFWNDIGGDWQEGTTPWLDTAGRPVTDVGGALLGILEDRGIEWLPLLRSNVVDLHPVFFAVYGDVVYHHGAGFRPPAVRATNKERDIQLRGPLPRGAVGLPARAWRSARLRAARASVRRDAARVQTVAERVFARIQHDPEFFFTFTGGSAPTTADRHVQS